MMGSLKFSCDMCKRQIGTSDDDVWKHVEEFHVEETYGVKDNMFTFIEQNISEESNVVVIEA